MYILPLQADLPDDQQAAQEVVSNALNGHIGEHLDSLIVYGETMLWGGTSATGESVTGAAGLMIGMAAALGAIFAVVLAGQMAYKSMAEGKGIDVLELLQPIMIALVLANWYGVTAGLYNIFRPIESRFRSVYVWSNERVDSLRDRRTILLDVVEGEIEEKQVEAIISEVRQRRGVTEKEEEEEEMQVQDGDSNQTGIAAAYTDAEFGDVMNDDVSGTPDEEKQGNFDLMEFFTWARVFHFVEDGILWVGEVIWAIAVYTIFLIKYLFAYVLIMFGPIYMVCSILGAWRNAWSQWLGQFVMVGMYGMAAYTALIFGLMIIEASTNMDINAIEYAMLDDDRFIAYVKSASSLDNLTDLAMYVTAVCVTAVALGLSFELAGLVFPSDGGRMAAQFFSGVQRYIQTKWQQAQHLAQEAAAGALVTAATGSAATAAFITKKLAEKHDEERERESIAQAEKDIPQTDDEPKDDCTRGYGARFQTRDDLEREYRERQEAKSKKDDWILKAEGDEREAKAREELERAMGGDDNPAVKLNRMAEDAYSWADRTAYLSAYHAVHRHCTEDIMADIRDRMKVDEAEKRGIKDEYLKLREARLRENRFLIEMVSHQGLNTNNSLTARQKLAIKLFGEARAAKYIDKSILGKQLHGTPRLTSWGALFGRDTLTSSKEDRRMLKRLGIYRDVQRAEMLRRMANSYLAPRIQPAKKFMGITVRGEKYKFRNWLHKKLYMSCMKNLATTEALIALRCRGILADRDIHISESGRPIYIPNADLYWRRDIDIAAYNEAIKQRGAAPFSNENARWFLDRYGSKEEASKMKLELEVFETLRRAAEAEDYVIERQLKAKDEKEIELWKHINDDYHTYTRVKQVIDRILESYEDGHR